MKKITLLLSFIACVVFAHAQLLLKEDFDYAVGQELIPNGWLNTGTAATPNILVTAASMTYSGYPGSGIGNEVTLLNGQDVNHTFTAQTSGLVYASFLVNAVAVPLTGDYFIHFGADVIGSGFVGRVFVKKDATNKVAFGIQLNSGGTVVPTYTSLDYDLNTTYLIVLKHDNTGKVSSIIVNPSMSTEPSTGWFNDSQGTNAVPANIGSIGLRQPSLSAALNVKLDGLRVATSYAALFATSGLSALTEDKLEVKVIENKLSVINATSNTVEIFNAIGAKVQFGQLESGSIQLNDLSKGLYIVRVGGKTTKIML